MLATSILLSAFTKHQDLSLPGAACVLVCVHVFRGKGGQGEGTNCAVYLHSYCVCACFYDIVQLNERQMQICGVGTAAMISGNLYMHYLLLSSLSLPQTVLHILLSFLLWEGPWYESSCPLLFVQTALHRRSLVCFGGTSCAVSQHIMRRFGACFNSQRWLTLKRSWLKFSGADNRQLQWYEAS